MGLASLHEIAESLLSLSAVHIMRLQGEIDSLGKKRVLTRT